MARGKNNVVEGIVPVKAIQELNTQTDEDKIIAYLNSETKVAKLSNKLQKLLKRYEFAYDTYKSKRSVAATLNVLIKKDWEGENISRRTARRDLQMAQRIYSDGSDHDRKINIDFMLGDIKKDIDLARINKDFKAVAKLREIELKIINDHMGDNAAELYKQLQMNVIMVGRFPEKLKTPLPPADELLQRLENLKKKKVTDILEAEETSYTINGDK